MEEEMEHIFTAFLEGTNLGCAGDLCEGSTQGYWQTRDQERAAAGSYAISGQGKYRKITTVMGKTHSTEGRLIQIIAN